MERIQAHVNREQEKEKGVFSARKKCATTESNRRLDVSNGDAVDPVRTESGSSDRSGALAERE